MTSDKVKKVQAAIKSYIDNIDDAKIEDRALDKIEGIYKAFLSGTYKKVKPIFKENNVVKHSVSEIKKRKVKAGSNKQEKINFTKEVIVELIGLFRQQEVLDDLIRSHKDLLQKEVFIKSWNKYEKWISWALDFGKESYLATHISKLTHSSSKGTSIDVRYYHSCDKYNAQYLFTDKKTILDTAYPDNKYSSISQLYNIEVDGEYIGDLLRNDGEKCLRILTANNELLKSWCGCFSQFIRNENKKSYFLSKQIYFPVKDRKYHLLLPLTSSSLVHELHLEHKRYWDEEQEMAREQKRNKKHSATITKTYPNKAYLHVTGSNHSNASSLNGKRGGRISLLPAMPPQWQSYLQFNINKSTVFDKSLGFELNNEIDDLRKYLLLIKNKSLSINEPKRNAAVLRKLRAVSDNFFNYVDKINSSMPSANWSRNASLPIEQQLLFEPWRADEAARAIKTDKQWEKTLAQSYGRWLSKLLKQKNKLPLIPIHEALWADVFLLELREFIAIQEVIV